MTPLNILTAAQFFAPDDPDNLAPGIWYLEYIGFLGSAPRPLRGVRSTDAEFAEALKSRGAPVYVGLRDSPVARCFPQCSTRPERPEDIVALAEAIRATREGESAHLEEPMSGTRVRGIQGVGMGRQENWEIVGGGLRDRSAGTDAS